MLTVRKLRRTFTTGSAPVRAVDGIDFDVAEGELAAIVGKSGSGKSTLLALLGTLDAPDEGTIEVNGENVTAMRGKQLLAYRRKTIGFVFQQYNLIPNLSAFDNVLLPMEFLVIPSHERQERAHHLFAQVGLAPETVRRLPGKLSGGEQQRVAIARALANHPKLILADEPTGNLDSQTSKTIIELLRSLARSEHTTVIAVTHDTAIARHADRVFHLHDGKFQERAA